MRLREALDCGGRLPVDWLPLTTPESSTATSSRRTSGSRKMGGSRSSTSGWPSSIPPSLQVPTVQPSSFHQQTHPGQVLGTVGYMSPEQVRGQPADARSDIFAVGVVLYEMLTGKPAFRKATSAETMTAILNEDPPAVSQLAPNLPPGLQRVVNRCLSKNPEQRIQHATDLAFALEALSDSTIGSASAISLASSRRVLMSAAGMLLLMAVGLGWYLRRSSASSQHTANSSYMEVKTLTESGKVTRVAVSQDGRYVAYVKKEAGNYEVRLLQVATERDVQVLPGTPKVIRSLHFSPDGNFIYFLQQMRREDSNAAGVFRIATLGGPATLLDGNVRTTDARNGSVTVSPDGKQVAYIDRTATESLIVAVEPDGSNRHVLAKRPIGRDFWFLEWSPVVDTLAAVAGGDEDLGLVSVELPSGTMRDLSVKGWGAMGQPVWSPDGSSIFAPADGGPLVQLWTFDARTGSHKPLTSSSTPFLLWTLSSSANGDLVAATETAETTLWVADLSSRNPRLLPSIKGEGDDGVAWIGNRIVTSNVFELQVHDLDGQGPTKLQSTSNQYRDLARCGPDKAAYWAFDAKHHIHIALTDITTGVTTALTDGPNDTGPTCTADGSTLVFTHCTKQNGPPCVLARKSLQSGQSAVIVDFGSDADWEKPMLSSDGTQVFFAKENAKDPYAWGMIVPSTGGTPKSIKMPISEGEVGEIKWAPDGKSFLYSKSENGVANIWSAPIDGKTSPKKITNFQSDRIFAFDVSPDNRLAISRGVRVSDVVLIKNVR